LIAKIKENARMRIPVFGNGDMDSPQKAFEYKNRYGVDGIMIGRAAIGYPWIFNEIKEYLASGEHRLPPDISERVRVTRKHFDFSIRWKGDKVGVFEMRRHYASYFKGLPDFKPFRSRLVEANDPESVYAILDEIIAVYGNRDIPAPVIHASQGL
jgi:tRNA-dihydrouridine synthase B